MKEIIVIPSFEPDKCLIQLIKSIDKRRFDIVVINDGSGQKYNEIYSSIQKDVHLISYEKNRGKGYALKKGFKYIKEKYSNNYVIVTMDSDGQHKIADAIKLLNYIQKHPNVYALGMRRRNKKTPWRSKMGNGITKAIFSLTTGVKIYDTQTGLRCFSYLLTDFMLKIPGNRFEYEMNALLLSSKNDIELHEIEIETIYIDNNKGSHFKAVRDSFLIYQKIMSYSLPSLIAFFLDFIIFVITTFFIKSFILCNIISKGFSLLCYFSYKQLKKHTNILNYYLIAIFILIFNTILLNIFVENFYINKYIAKFIVEIYFIFIYKLANQK